MNQQEYLFDKVAKNDIIKVRALSSPALQVIRGKVMRIYSARIAIDDSCLGKEIEFVQSPGTWGDVPLAVGEDAIIFIRRISDRLYEDPWRGHMVVEKIGEESYAIFQHSELWLRDEVPLLLKQNAMQDPKRTYATAIKLDVVENYLEELVKKLAVI